MHASHLPAYVANLRRVSVVYLKDHGGTVWSFRKAVPWDKVTIFAVTIQRRLDDRLSFGKVPVHDNAVSHVG